jgi:putative restriction endonuclease
LCCALNPDEPFLFKLHAPHRFIAGAEFLAHRTIMPVSLARQAFEEKNGSASLRGTRQSPHSFA